MNRLIFLTLLVFLPSATLAEEDSAKVQSGLISTADEYELNDFLWHFRPIVIFADTAADPRFTAQMERIRAEIDVLAERDVLVLTDTDPALKSPVRQKLRPRGFQVVLIGKDGKVLMRRPGPQSVRELTRSIDKLTTRQREVEERRGI